MEISLAYVHELFRPESKAEVEFDPYGYVPLKVTWPTYGAYPPGYVQGRWDRNLWAMLVDERGALQRFTLVILDSSSIVHTGVPDILAGVPEQIGLPFLRGTLPEPDAATEVEPTPLRVIENGRSLLIRLGEATPSLLVRTGEVATVFDEALSFMGILVQGISPDEQELMLDAVLGEGGVRRWTREDRYEA